MYHPVVLFSCSKLIRKTDTQLSSASRSSNGCTVGVGSRQNQGPKIHPGLPHRWQKPTYFGHYLFSPRCISRKPDWKQNSQNSHPHSDMWCQHKQQLNNRTAMSAPYHSLTFFPFAARLNSLAKQFNLSFKSSPPGFFFCCHQNPGLSDLSWMPQEALVQMDTSISFSTTLSGNTTSSHF